MIRADGAELATVMALDIECEDCGRARRFQRRKIRELEAQGFRTVEQIGDRLYCRACHERAGGSRNVKIIPRLIGKDAGRGS